MNEVDHFGLWACQLALDRSWRQAMADHWDFSDGLRRRDPGAVQWAAACYLAMVREADNYREGER